MHYTITLSLPTLLVYTKLFSVKC